MTGFLLINPRAGDARPDAVELERAARTRGLETYLLGDGDDPLELARRATADALGAAGGDGSLACVAQAALERDLPFVCVALGTRNHFVRDLGLDRDDPFGALASFDGVERRIDVGRVNGRLFLNNVSLGAYAQLVHGRGRFLRLALGRDRLRLRVDDEPVEARVVVVGNNVYRLEPLALGQRESLVGGTLQLWTAAGWLPRTWEERRAPELEIETEARQVEAAVDGEPVLLDSPLRFQILPRALRVLVPREAPVVENGSSETI